MRSGATWRKKDFSRERPRDASWGERYFHLYDPTATSCRLHIRSELAGITKPPGSQSRPLALYLALGARYFASWCLAYSSGVNLPPLT